MPINKDILRRVAGASLVATALFTAGFEGRSTTVYKDPVGVATICDGHARTGPDGKPLKAGQTATDEVCDYLLGKDIADANASLLASVKVPLSTGENLAYTDFVFNEGIGNFQSSTLLRKLNSGDHKGACAQLLLWTKGKVRGVLVDLRGLVKRRGAEYKACLD